MKIERDKNWEKVKEAFQTAETSRNTREKLHDRLDKLIIENKEKLGKYKNNTKKFIIEIFKIWILEGHNLRGDRVKLFRFDEKMRNLKYYLKCKTGKEISPKLSRELKTFIMNLTANLKDNMIAVPLSQAPLLNFEEGMKICNEMYYNSKNVTSKLSAIILKISIYTGARTGDLIDLRWRSIKITRAFNGVKTLNLFCETKTNQHFKLPGRKDIFCPKSDKHNPLKWLKSLAIGVKSENDYVFPMKNGHITTTNCVYHIRTACERLNLTSYYSGHSARNALIATLSLAGVPDESLRIMAEWSANSVMPQLYKRNNLGLSKKGTAFKVMKLIETNEISNLQSQIESVPQI